MSHSCARCRRDIETKLKGSSAKHAKSNEVGHIESMAFSLDGKTFHNLSIKDASIRVTRQKIRYVAFDENNNRLEIQKGCFKGNGFYVEIEDRKIIKYEYNEKTYSNMDCYNGIKLWNDNDDKQITIIINRIFEEEYSTTKQSVDDIIKNYKGGVDADIIAKKALVGGETDIISDLIKFVYQCDCGRRGVVFL